MSRNRPYEKPTICRSVFPRMPEKILGLVDTWPSGEQEKFMRRIKQEPPDPRVENAKTMRCTCNDKPYDWHCPTCGTTHRLNDSHWCPVHGAKAHRMVRANGPATFEIESID